MPQTPVQRDTRRAKDVAAVVRLHHRRRGWSWVAASSAIGLAVYGVLDIHLLANRTRAAGAVSAIPVFALLALALLGLVVVIVETSRLHRVDEAVLLSAKGSVSHYPWYAHAHRWPPRHPASWVAAIFTLLALTCITAYIVPQEVNAWAYVVGGANHDTFNPVSYSTSCSLTGRHGLSCQTVTQGYLSHSGANVIWGSQVPLNQPLSVRDPLWPWGTGRILTNGDGSAITTIVAGLFFDGVTLLLLYVLVVLLRETSPRRNQRVLVAAAADPGTVRRPHQPERAHHSDGTRRRARRRRGAR